MRSHDQLVRAHPDPRVHLRAVDQDDSVIVRIFHEVGDPHLWSAESWASYGSAPAMRHWLIYVGGEPAGLLTLRAEPDGEIEIVYFGLVPDRQGHGFGGPALTLAVDLAWTAFGGEVSRCGCIRTTSTTPALCQLPEKRVHDRRGGRSSGERSRQLGAVEFSIAVPFLED